MLIFTVNKLVIYKDFTQQELSRILEIFLYFTEYCSKNFNTFSFKKIMRLSAIQIVIKI